MLKQIFIHKSNAIISNTIQISNPLNQFVHFLLSEIYITCTKSITASLICLLYASDKWNNYSFRARLLQLKISFLFITCRGVYIYILFYFLLFHSTRAKSLLIIFFLLVTLERHSSI